MPANLSERAAQYRARIKVNQTHVAHKMDVMEDHSGKAVEQLGPMAEKFEERLRNRLRDMPYDSIKDLPKAQIDQYRDHQKEAFFKAFNSALKKYGGDDHRALAVAHAAAKRAGRPD